MVVFSAYIPPYSAARPAQFARTERPRGAPTTWPPHPRATATDPYSRRADVGRSANHSSPSKYICPKEINSSQMRNRIVDVLPPPTLDEDFPAMSLTLPRWI